MSDERTITVSEGGFQLPVVEILTGRGCVFGKSGSGKSNSVGVISEELLAEGFPLCIVDADGEHYGLKEEYELLHVGGDESADVIVGPEHAESLAEVMLNDDTPVILDVSGYIDESESDELVERVLSKLFSMEKKAKKPFPVFIEEAHEYVPETNHPDSLASTIIKCGKRGRKHGLGIVCLSQRPAEVKKSFTTQSNWSIWHKLTWSQDTSVVKEVINSEYAEAVQDLAIGQAIVNCDWMESPKTIHFKKKQTFDAGATPGLEEFEAPELKGVSDDVIDRLESITESKVEEAEETEELRDEVERLRAEKSSLEEEVDELRSGDTVESEEVDRLQTRIETLRSERDTLQHKVNSLQAENDKLEDELDSSTSRISALESELVGLDDATEHIEAALDALGERERPPETDLGESVEIDEMDYYDFIEREVVQDAIETAKDEATAQKYVTRMLSAIIAEGGKVTYDEVADSLGLSTTNHVSNAATALESVGVVTKKDVNNRSSPTGVDLNVDGIDEIMEKREKRERHKEIEDML